MRGITITFAINSLNTAAFSQTGRRSRFAGALLQGGYPAMTCPKCKSDQPDNARFCSQCSEPLAQDSKKTGSNGRTWAWIALAALFLGLVLTGFITSRNPGNTDPNEALLRSMAQ